MKQFGAIKRNKVINILYDYYYKNSEASSRTFFQLRLRATWIAQSSTLQILLNHRANLPEKAFSVS